MKHIKDSKGFTLVELLIVISILALIAGFAVPRYLDVYKNAKSESEGTDVQLVQAAVDLFAFDQEKDGKDSLAVWNILTGTSPAAISASDKAMDDNPTGFFGKYLKKNKDTFDLTKFNIDDDLVVTKPAS